jgi:hypothetical protein
MRLSHGNSFSSVFFEREYDQLDKNCFSTNDVRWSSHWISMSSYFRPCHYTSQAEAMLTSFRYADLLLIEIFHAYRTLFVDRFRAARCRGQNRIRFVTSLVLLTLSRACRLDGESVRPSSLNSQITHHSRTSILREETRMQTIQWAMLINLHDYVEGTFGVVPLRLLNRHSTHRS